MIFRDTLFFSLVLFAFLVPVGRAAPAESPVDVLSYEIDATINADHIESTVTLNALAARKVKKLHLQLAGAIDIQTCRIDEQEIPFERSGWDLDLDLGKAGVSKGPFSIVFELKGKPYVKFSQKRGGYVRSNVCAEHAYIRSQYAWYPRVADDMATYEIILKARKDWIVHTAGNLTDKKEEGGLAIWRFEHAVPDRRIGLAAGGYVEVKRSSKKGMDLKAIVFPGHEAGGKNLLAYVERAIDFFTKLYGPIEGQSFTLVEMPAPFGRGSGYGETGYVLIGTGAFEDGGGSFWGESLVAHEVSHSWWGHEVRFEHFASEMFATYATHRYMEMSQGRESARAERKEFTRRVVATANRGQVPLGEIRDWGAKMDPAVYRAHAYEKGAMILHTLEKEMGRKEFDAAAARFLDTYRGETIDYDVVRKKLAPTKWKWIFTQWGEPGIPRIRAEYESKKSGSSYTVKGTIFQEGTKKPFKMTVAISLRADDQIQTETIEVKKNKTSFKLSCPFDPQELIVDPDSHLLCEVSGKVDIEELKKTVFEVANNPKMAESDTLQKTVKDIRKILGADKNVSSAFRTALGRCLFRLGELDAAKKEFEVALKGGAGGPFHQCWIYLRLGCIADLEKERSEARKCYEKVLTFSDAKNHDYQKKLASRFLEKPYRGHKVDG